MNGVNARVQAGLEEVEGTQSPIGAICARLKPAKVKRRGVNHMVNEKCIVVPEKEIVMA